MSHNPCFSGNSFAIFNELFTKKTLHSHNPCFSGNSFAIGIPVSVVFDEEKSQSLF